jgi:O-6-methylguanine DNA methyltransferase
MIVLSAFDSPLGKVAVAERANKLLCVHFGSIVQLKRDYPQVMHLGETVETEVGPLAQQLSDYLNGQRSSLRVAVDFALVSSDFQRQVLQALYRLPRGKTVSYQELGKMAGHERAARAVGSCMRRNPLAVVVPCHRVLPQSGGLGAYTGGVEKKAWLLAREGVTI